MATCAELRSKQDFYFYIRIFLCSSHNYHAPQQQTLAAYRCKSKVNNFKSLFLTSNVKASWCIYSEKCGRRLQTGVWMTSWATAAADEQLRAVKKIQLVPNVKLKDFCRAQINWRKVKMMYLLQISQNKYYIKWKSLFSMCGTVLLDAMCLCQSASWIIFKFLTWSSNSDERAVEAFPVRL